MDRRFGGNAIWIDWKSNYSIYSNREMGSNSKIETESNKSVITSYN